MHLEDVAAELIQLLRSMRDPSAGKQFVVGHSMGGVLATLIAEQWPDAVAGMLNVEGNVTRADCEVVSDTIVASARGGLASLERALAAVANGCVTMVARRHDTLGRSALPTHAWR